MRLRGRQVVKLLADDATHSGEDVSEAAFLFHYGARSDDYL
ncbi:hypothetical protein [Granulicella tundricola]|nr:hypothetical protein [Granulicella tundricola]